MMDMRWWRSWSGVLALSEKSYASAVLILERIHSMGFWLGVGGDGRDIERSIRLLPGVFFCCASVMICYDLLCISISLL